MDDVSDASIGIPGATDYLFKMTNLARSTGQAALRARRGHEWLITLSASLLVMLPGTALAQSGTEAATTELRARFEGLPTSNSTAAPAAMVVSGELLFARQALGDFYPGRDYRPAWTTGGRPGLAVAELIGAIHGAFREGLDPRDYHLEELDDLWSQLNETGLDDSDPATLADFDLLASDAFMLLGSHLLSGRVNPETIHSEWLANRRGGDFAAVLDTALSGRGVAVTLEGLLPRQPGYARLRSALTRYRALEPGGAWPSVSEGRALEQGDRGERVGELRRRLEAEYLLERSEVGDEELFDARLDDAIRTFQERHGLSPDGVVGAGTLAALNVPIEDRISQIELNLERWRWLPADLGRRHIRVNIGAYSLEVVDQGTAVLSMRAIVGRTYRRTPVFSDTITYLVLNPYWNVPHDLAVLDKLPLIKKDPSYLASQRIRVYGGWSAGAQEIDPATVDWQTLGGRNFSYRLIQEPGPNNALGRIKFMFPNKFNVYLHDTPGRELFSKDRRDFSSGCIRVEDPIGLAAYLLSGDGRWTRASIEAALATGRDQTVTLGNKMPVHLLYWTAWANEDGSISFRPDIYGRDSVLDQALHTRAPDA